MNLTLCTRALSCRSRFGIVTLAPVKKTIRLWYSMNEILRCIQTVDHIVHIKANQLDIQHFRPVQPQTLGIRLVRPQITLCGYDRRMNEWINTGLHFSSLFTAFFLFISKSVSMIWVHVQLTVTMGLTGANTFTIYTLGIVISCDLVSRCFKEQLLQRFWITLSLSFLTQRERILNSILLN